jgi:DNA-binding NtrC family response regulator
MLRFARKHGVRVGGISALCQAALMAHSWPGNVRELQNVVERAVILNTDGGNLQHTNLGIIAPGASSESTAGLTGIAPVENELAPLAEIERRHIMHALEHCQGNRTHTADKLGISIRTLRNKLNEYGSGPKADDKAETV